MTATAQPMKGDNFYNENSDLQREVTAKANPFLSDGADQLVASLDASQVKAIGIGDLGCSQGGNSLAPVSLVISRIRQNAALAKVPICVYHEDVSTNDWNSVFKVLDKPESYLKHDEHVFAYACGKSFYKPLFPPETMHFMFSFNALHWMSRVPPVRSLAYNPHDPNIHPEDHKECARIAEEDLNNFLTYRAVELVKGGKMVLSIISYTPMYSSVGFDFMFGKALRENLITEEEGKKLMSGIYVRTEEEIRQVLAKHTDKFSVDLFQVVKVSNPLFVQYKQGLISMEKCKTLTTKWFQAFSEPGMVAALAHKSEADRQKVLDIVWAEFGKFLDLGVDFENVTTSIRLTKL